MTVGPRWRSRGWEQGSGRTVADLLDDFAGAGVAAVVVTAIDRDGTLAGPDLDGLADVLASTEHPGHRVGRGGERRPTSRRWPPWPCRRSCPMARGRRPRRLSGAITGKALVDGRMTVEEGLAACAPSG